MMSISPNTVEASVEKHLPVVRFEGNKTSVSVGSIEHPMNPEHYIEWIVLETDHGFRIEYLEPGNKPEVFFNKDEAMPIAVYAYCNLHGLWKTDMV
ncbi:desulfoferrodoxin family protein [Mobilitalea sibirica]